MTKAADLDALLRGHWTALVAHYESLPFTPKPTRPVTEGIAQWYAVHTDVRREQTAVDGLEERGFIVFCPSRTSWHRTQGSKEKVYKPLFVGYVFVLCEPEDFSDIHAVDGVQRFVRWCVNGELSPVPIPTPAILDMQIKEAQGEYDETRGPKPPYKPKKHERVKVKAGTWAGYVGKMLSTPAKDMAKVMIEGPYGQSVKVAVKNLEAA